MAVIITALESRSSGYDPAGNTTSSTAVNLYTAIYNLAGRLATLTNAGVTTTGKAVRECVWLGSTPIAVFTPAASRWSLRSAS